MSNTADIVRITCFVPVLLGWIRYPGICLSVSLNKIACSFVYLFLKNNSPIGGPHFLVKKRSFNKMEIGLYAVININFFLSVVWLKFSRQLPTFH